MKEIPLSGKYAERFAIIDDSDFEAVSKHSWTGCNSRGELFYARTRIAGKTVMMHRLIMASECNGLEVDHRDGDGLNNQRSNLRAVTHSENLQNTHRHRTERAAWLAWIRDHLGENDGSEPPRGRPF